MHKNISTLVIVTSIAFFTISPAFAVDARTAAVGGSAIANGYGVYGVRENPSSLMRMHRQQQRFHFHSGVGVDIQDNAGIIDNAIEQDTLVKDIEQEIDLITGSQLICNIDDGITSDETCVDGTQKLGDLATTVFDIVSRADNKPIRATAAADFGVAISTASIPVALHYRLSATVRSNSDITDNDLEYINGFATALSDDRLTFAELITNVPFSISPVGPSLVVGQPEDVLESDVQGNVLIRSQFGLSVARSFAIAGFNVDIGVTPKFSSLRAAGINTGLGEQFNENTDSLTRQLENSEITDNSFTADLGATTRLHSLPLQLSVVARNMIKESITTQDGFVFETTPQLIVGSAFSIGSLTLTGDLALNEAKVDSLDTQILAVGIDYSRKFFGLRAGIGHDNARTDDATALSLGVSLGPVHIGGRITDWQSAQAGAQIAFSF